MRQLTRLITLFFFSLLFSSAQVNATTITLTFETLPGPDGILGTADDLPTSTDFITSLSNQYSSVGINFSQGSLLRAGFYDGNPNNHFISSTNPIGTFSVPVFGLSIESNSFWDAVMTVYNADGKVIAAQTLVNPNAGISFFSGLLSLSTAEPIFGFSILPTQANHILNLDNLSINVSDVPEPSQLMLFALGMLMLFGYRSRRSN
ncbi:PEP-CTERM sorting domain-containing protein [Undibacterium sp. Rencai35W]|uniref:PEP-CTERM sorting domain-containing protein n=1 Tax=Undibacterium sp. Rencai35W TaxID=3413046 RepID=UPI003BEFC681